MKLYPLIFAVLLYLVRQMCTVTVVMLLLAHSSEHVSQSGFFSFLWRRVAVLFLICLGEFVAGGLGIWCQVSVYKPFFLDHKYCNSSVN